VTFYIIIISVLTLALVLTNFGWLFALIKLTNMWQDKQTELLDRINVLANKPAMPWYRSKVKPGEKAPEEMKPKGLKDDFFDPEYEAVGKVDPGFIDRARGKNNG
jgi:hypothetical protein